jgi:hypothetical protein
MVSTFDVCYLLAMLLFPIRNVHRQFWPGAERYSVVWIRDRACWAVLDWKRATSCTMFHGEKTGLLKKISTYSFGRSSSFVSRDLFDCALDLDEIDVLISQFDYTC